MQKYRFIEHFDLTTVQEAIKGGRVDRTNGLMKGVKLMGFESLNGRTYRKPDSKLFENVKVRLNHYAEEDDPNPPSPMFEDNWGFTRNVTVSDEGVFADIVFDPHQEHVPSILWWAENNPNVGGFSPITWGYRSEQNGETFIDIVAVESVDLVNRPATTRGFFEEIKTMDPKDVLKLQESLAAANTEKATLAKQVETLTKERDAALTKSNEDAGKLAARMEADRKLALRTERLKLVADANLGEISNEFKEQVVTAATDEGAKVLVETLKTALGSPRSISTNPADATGSNGNKGVKTYEEAKTAGLLIY